ncbi:MAG: 1-deoxy-D-xylulose 5-phosphate reductoisomerase [Alphaproteobacteria bacterium]|nr:MAG: 1-deoxy-D-xylulose 5-phosphate reductoisomerase [Alphaproteobacteria bacterium]
MTHKNIILLGATGSIGTSTLNLIRKRREKFNLIGVSAYEKTEQLKLISEEFNVKNVCFFKNDQGITFDESIKVMKGHQGLLELASLNCDIVVSGISGLAGLMPAYVALNNGNHIAIANKEPLVVAGNILIECSKKNNVKILPVDSEHNSIFQCFDNNLRENISHITLTASGGPFLNRSLNSFCNITIEEALKHPKWEMGKKISIDSATLINKALEVIEAGFLFELKSNQINVVIHPESIIHGLVHYKDGSVLANLALPDMISPLSVAIGYPERYNLDLPKLNLVEVSQLNFLKPDLKKFPGLNFGWHALNEPNYFSIILNASNEIAVDLFLKKRIKFTSIVEIIDKCLNEQKFNSANNLEETLEIDKMSRIFAKKISEKFYV